jgi:hypothetical protein
MARKRVAEGIAQTSNQPRFQIEVLDPVATIAALPRRVVAVLWALVAMRAMTGRSGTTYRTLAAMVGIADRKNVKTLCRKAQADGLLSITIVNRRAVVEVTDKCNQIASMLFHAVPTPQGSNEA